MSLRNTARVKVMAVLLGAALAVGCTPVVPPSVTAAPPAATRQELGPRIEAGLGYRMDEDGVRVVHLRGSDSEMAQQFHALLEQEIDEFRELARHHRGMQPYIGCSNFAAFGPRSADGSLWHGRNFDFAGQGVLDTYIVVFIVEPDDRIPYVTVSWPGPYPWDFRGVQTAMNAEGISLGYMISESSDEMTDGVPTLWGLYRRVMENAHSLDEALDILEKGPRRGAANLLVADGEGQDAVVVEMTSAAFVVRKAQEGAVSSTNHFASNELFEPTRIDVDSMARLERLAQLTAAPHPGMDLEQAVAILRDRRDSRTGVVSPSADVIGTSLNMVSVVFHPADLTFWVADGPAPAAYGEFVGFSLRDELDGTQAQTSVPSVPPDTSIGAQARAEIDAFQAGLLAYFRADDEAAVQHFSRAVELDPASARYSLFLGNALARLGRTDEAIAALEAATSQNLQGSFAAFLYNRLGLLYEEVGDDENARMAFGKLLDLDVGNAALEAHARQVLGR